MGRSWVALEALLGAFGVLLGQSWAMLSALGCSWGTLGAFWVPFGSDLGCSWGALLLSAPWVLLNALGAILERFYDVFNRS